MRNLFPSPKKGAILYTISTYSYHTTQCSQGLTQFTKSTRTITAAVSKGNSHPVYKERVLWESDAGSYLDDGI